MSTKLILKELSRYKIGTYTNIIYRKRNVIISGGENIYSCEMEKIISQYPSVEEVAVTSIPDSH